MNFPETEKYLRSLGNEVIAIKLGLDAMRRLLAALGNPEVNFLKVQVAGTNGKGSVCAFIDSICREAGIRTGVFTSPHLISITERVSLSGVDITEADFAGFATLVRETAEKLVAEREIETIPTYFEQVTAIALTAFAEAAVELALLETGLGGRLDATTAVGAEIAAITRIGLDHQEYLGETIEQIAAEKAAIIHPDSTVVIAKQSREAKDVITGRCREAGVEPIWATERIATKTYSEGGYRFVSSTFTTDKRNYPKVELHHMLGAHQIENAAVAIGLAEVLEERGFGISEFDVCLGLETAKNRGRLDYQGRFLFDGAHNVGGAHALASYLDEFEQRPITLVFGAMQGKAVGEMAGTLFPRATHVILTKPSNSRSMSVEEIQTSVPDDTASDSVFLIESVDKAIKKALDVTNDDGLILVTGSLYLVGEAKRILKSQI